MQKPAQHRSPVPRASISFTRKRFYGAQAVGSFLPALTTKALQKYGFSTATLILDWPSIAGRELARHAIPERIKWPSRAVEQAEDEERSARARRAGAVLVLRVDGSKALDVQYRAPQIIERINSYFGYAAVAQLRVVQGPMPVTAASRPQRPRPVPLTREVAGIGDAGLRDALARLGAEIRTSN